MKNNQKYTGLEVAIVGMACRFPGAPNWQAFWNNLVQGTESVRFFSADELAALGMPKSEVERPGYVRAGAYLDDKDAFDAAFFDYRPHEAKAMHPEHRVFHECVWEALEDAGYVPGESKGLTGLFAGAGQDLNWKVYSMLQNASGEMDEFTLSHLNNKDYLASLVAYKLNLAGPAFSVNTACSTSLVAVNLACKSLLFGEVKMAVAGGVTLNTQKQKGYQYQEGMIDSADGHCRAFDKNASGCVGGEGAGVVVLKRLADAIKDEDQIYAVIRGSAINSDGNRKVGFTAPSIEGQADCIRKALVMAAVEPETVSYVEAHGTGTRLGDPIELAALNLAFNHNRNHQCAIGSVKTNIGHLDTAAGIAGLIKTALCMKFRQLPATLHFGEPNPEVDFAAGPFYVNAALSPWASPEGVLRRAGVSSFGIGGTNAHVVLEEAPPATPAAAAGPERPFRVLTLSAKSEQALRRYADRIKEFVRQTPGVPLPDVSYTLATGRRHFKYRSAIVYRDAADLLPALEHPQPGAHKTLPPAGPPVFMFPGQGSQYTRMGLGLYRTEPGFRQTMDEGFGLIEQLTGERYQRVLFPPEGESAAIADTKYTQPLVFLVEYALARLVMSWGLAPAGMIGHSIGEYTAACLAGVFSFPDALRLLVARANLISRLPPGGMVSASLNAADAGDYLSAGLSLAAVNGPRQVVFSGDSAAIAGLTERLNQAGVPFVRLSTSHAFHSAMLDEVLPAFAAELGKITLHRPQLSFVSNVTGDFAGEEVSTAAYWVRHLRETVRFSEGMGKLLQMHPAPAFVEVGPGHTLVGLLRQHAPGPETAGVNLMRTGKESGDDAEYLLKRIGQLWQSGGTIDWQGYYKPERRRKVSLPTYPFEQGRFPTTVNPLEQSDLGGGLLSRNELKDSVYYPVWKNEVAMPAAHPPGRKVYVLFADNQALEAAFEQAVSPEAGEVVRVRPGETYARRSRLSYTVPYADAESYRALFETLKRDGLGATDIVYCWTMLLGQEPVPLHPGSRELHLAYLAVANILKALLAEAGDREEKRITLVTDGLHPVTGLEKGSYAASLALGLVNVISQEHGSIACRHIDVCQDDQPRVLARQLLAELSVPDPAARIVALRNGRRWVPDFQRNTQELEGANPPLKKGGVYLLTGGLGNLGYVLGRHLAAKYGAKLVLTGRTRLDDGRQHPVLLHRLHELRKMGSDVMYYPVDVADAAALRQMAVEVARQLGPIRGIIHAAGNINRRDFELSEDITAAKTLSVFAAKVGGVAALHEVFKDAALDFVWLASSLSATLGGISYAAYAAANAYMNHFVTALTAQLPHWKSVELSELAFAGEDNAAGPRQPANGLIPEEITALFEWSLTVQGAPVLLQTRENLRARLQRAYQAPAAGDAPGANQPAAGASPAERPSVSTIYSAPQTDTEIRLAGLIEAFFGIEGIGAEDSFFELGGDSLKAMILLKKIKETFQINMGLEDFFNLQNVKQIAALIDERMWLDNKSESEFVSII